MSGQALAEHGDELFTGPGIHRIESPGARAVEIEHADQAAFDDDRYDQFGTARRVACDVPGKGLDIFHHLRLARRRGGAAHPAAQCDADAGRLALERPQHKLVPDQPVKARPVEIGQILPQQRRDIGHVGDRIGLARGQRLGRRQHIAVQVILRPGGHIELVHQSILTLPRPALTVARPFYSSTRFALADLLGRVGRRFLGTLVASRINSTSRSRTSWRLSNCDRAPSLRRTRTPSRVRRDPASTASLSLTASGRPGELATSKRNSTALSVVLTCCPPGPLDRVKLSTISSLSIDIARVIGMATMADAFSPRRSLPPRT